VWTASQGAITLEIGVHGIPVTMKQNVYDDLANGALNSYWAANLDDRDQMPYKRIFIGAIRAIDYIASLPEWDGKKLGVTGSSQGGMLSLVCAALDKRVTFYGAVHAAMCDHIASLKGVACGWPHYFYQVKNPDEKKIKVSGYYDGINFAKRITCPGWFSFGYNDEVVPPTSAFATYNTVKAPKTLSVYQQTGHYWYQEQWDEWESWLLSQMGITK
jgi:cephalosporin-C deacetylase-like acetyl esterase